MANLNWEIGGKSVMKVWAGLREAIRVTNSGGCCIPGLMGQRRNLGIMRLQVCGEAPFRSSGLRLRVTISYGDIHGYQEHGCPLTACDFVNTSTV